MNRAALFFALVAIAPAAGAAAWVPCEQPGIEAPVPLSREPPGYPPAVREIGVEGVVEVSLVVLRDGTVGWVRALSAEPRGYFEQAAIAGVRSWRFRPARAGGETIECRMVSRVRFALVDTVDVRAGSLNARRPVPVYPPELLQKRIEGYVEVEFDVTVEGGTAQARVIAAMPRGSFESASLAAIRRWHFDRGNARRETRRFEFRLPDSILGTVPAMQLASAPFPLAACEQKRTGNVMLEVRTDLHGAVLQARILSAAPPGLFDEAALAIARASRLTPAYRDGVPIESVALLTLFFDPARATCPGNRSPDRDRPPAYRPAPRVTRTMKGPAAATTG